MVFLFDKEYSNKVRNFISAHVESNLWYQITVHYSGIEYSGIMKYMFSSTTVLLLQIKGEWVLRGGEECTLKQKGFEIIRAPFIF